jgi:hypothetical protein
MWHRHLASGQAKVAAGGTDRRFAKTAAGGWLNRGKFRGASLDFSQKPAGS